MVNDVRTWALALLLAASCGPGGGTGGGGGGTGGGTGGTGGVLCIPGASAACTCTNGRQGAQVCNADGKSLGACVCSGDVGGGGTTGTGGIGGSVAANGGTGGASAGAGGAAGTGGTGLGCQGSLPPEIRFGSIGQGDANPSFQSAVGALGADAMYIFSGSTSSASGGASGSQTVYAQAFDLETGASRGPAQPLFSPPNLDLESAREPGGSVSLFAAAVADTGDIALAYQLKTSATSKAVLYVAFLAAPAATDGGAQALQLQDVRLVSLSASAGAAANDATNPKLFWSNASRTFVLNYVSRASQQPLASATALQISVLKYTASGQNAGGIGAVPVPSSFSEYPPKILAINGGVGESGSLLGVLYGGWDGVQSLVYRTTLGEDATPVGTPTSLGLVTPHTNMMEIAGTAKGFVCAFFGSQYVSVSFVPTSAGSGAADGGAGGGGFGGLMSLGPMTNAVGRAIADDVGSGGKGGVGLALGTAQGIVFGYVNADGTAIAGPTTVFPGDVEAMAMTNFNGRFAISAYSATAHSARVVASGVCP